MHKNLTIGYILSFLDDFYLPIAVWLLFFLQYLDFTQVAVLGALTVVSSNLFEIPTGAVSDLIGRKWTLFLSYVFSALGLLVISSGTGFVLFALGRVIHGLGKSLFSGTHESLLYDTLKSSGKESQFDTVISKSEMYSWFGLFLAAVSGGLLYDRWSQGPFIVTAVIYIFAAAVCLWIDEPKIDSEKFSWRTYTKQNLRGFTELFKDARTTQFTLLMITVTAGYVVAARILGISQAEQYGLSGTGIGILFGFGYIIAAGASHFYPRLRKPFGNTKLLIAATAALLASFIFAPFVGVVMGSFLITLRISSSTTFGNAKSVIMNRLIASKNRATALSTLRLLAEIPFTLSFYFIGRYIDTYSPNTFALLLGGIMVVLLLPQLYGLRKNLSLAFSNK